MDLSVFENIKVIIGTYEQFIVGYLLVLSSDSEDQFEFEQSFSELAHNGSVKCITTCEQFLVSGGIDERIRIFDIVSRKDIGTLLKQKGTITCLKFFQNSHLFSSSDNGTICVWDTRNWKCLKTLQGHKAGVNCLSVHPSGKLLLSVSKDKTLRTWNLIKGRCAYVTNIKAVANQVFWTPDASHFLVAFDKRIDLYDINLGACVHSFEVDKAINSLCFLNEILIVGLENGIIEFYDIDKKTFISRFSAHENRIKGLCCLHRCDKYWLFSVSSDGYLKCWQIKKLKKLNLITSIQTSCRINCLTLHLPKKTDEND